MAINKYNTSKGEVRYKATVWAGGRPLCSRSFRRKVDADEWHRRESLIQEDGRVGRFKGNSVSLSHFFNEVYFPNSGVRASTATDYLRIFKKYLAPKFGERKLMSISELEWASHFQTLKRDGVSSARVNRIHAVASAIYSLGVKWKYVSANPLLLVSWEQENVACTNKYWSEDELSRFMVWAHQNNPAMFLLYHFCYETGVRISEALALQWDCIDLDQGLIEIRRSYSRSIRQIEDLTKSGHLRTLALNETLRETVRKLFDQRQSKFVFSKDSGDMLSYETIRGALQRDQEAAGVPRLGMHGFRHTFASHFVMRGGSIYDLQALLGHSDIGTTMGYAHLSPAHLAKKSELVQFNIAGFVKGESINQDSTIDKKTKALLGQEFLQPSI